MSRVSCERRPDRTLSSRDRAWRSTDDLLQSGAQWFLKSCCPDDRLVQGWKRWDRKCSRSNLGLFRVGVEAKIEAETDTDAKG